MLQLDRGDTSGKLESCTQGGLQPPRGHVSACLDYACDVSSMPLPTREQATAAAVTAITCHPSIRSPDDSQAEAPCACADLV